MAAPKLTLAQQYPHILNLNDPQGLYALMHAYLGALRARNYAEDTIDGRERFLCQLLDWCGQRGLLRPTEITRPILERYQRHLYHYRKANGEPLSFRSQYNRLVAVRMWFNWLVRQHYIPTNPASDLELPKREKRLPKAVLSEREAETILNQPDVGDALGLRDRAMLEVLYSTGIRRMELVNLRVQDIDGERGLLTVRQGKGKKDRMIPIGERAARWVEKYRLDIRPAFVCGTDDGILFLGRYGHGMSPHNLAALVRGYVEQSGIGKAGACHLFRHTMATLMLENGADIRFIQAMLGHVSLSTTEIYTRVSIAKLKEIHTLTHPARLSRKAGPSGSAEASQPLPSTDHDEAAATAETLFTALAAEAAEDD